MNRVDFVSVFRAVMTAAGAALGWFFGDVGRFFYALVAFVAADFVTGVFAAVVKKKLSSAECVRGIARKLCVFILVGVAHVLDVIISNQAGVIRTAVIYFYIAGEGMSILENCVALGLPVPKKLRDVLAQIEKEAEDDAIDN